MNILDDLKNEGWQITIATVAVTDDGKKWQWIAEVDKDSYNAKIGPTENFINIINEVLAVSKRIKWGDEGDAGMDKKDMG